MNTAKSLFLIAILAFGVSFANTSRARTARWTEQKANAWYAQQPWLVGSNYNSRSAINELEMWQEATFSPDQIDQELGWAESLGMNTMRVFLHDLLWQQDADGFKKRIDQFLTIAAKHHIRPLFVLFDSCWDPLPHLGPQHPPIPGVHNSGWVQSPGAVALADPKQYPRLKAYVEGVVGAFAKDDRILGWDIWNEPGANNMGSYAKEELKDKTARVLRSEEHTSELQSQSNLVCRLLLEKKKNTSTSYTTASLPPTLLHALPTLFISAFPPHSRDHLPPPVPSASPCDE